MRRRLPSSIRLFLEPGMGHCGGGDGPNVFDKVDALNRWVEQGKAPEQTDRVAHHGREKWIRTRPLCPYPQVAAQIQGHRQHRRSGQLCLPHPVTDGLCRCVILFAFVLGRQT